LALSIIDMVLDPITKWLVRISSSLIIVLGLILVIAIPLLAFKVTSIITLIQEIIQSDLKDLLAGLVAKI
tara:strand:+ start:252 stop:461 length:210 start_codon:yes stop_codon:yes gene_type:complete